MLCPLKKTPEFCVYCSYFHNDLNVLLLLQKSDSFNSTDVFDIYTHHLACQICAACMYDTVPILRHAS